MSLFCNLHRVPKLHHTRTPRTVSARTSLYMDKHCAARLMTLESTTVEEKPNTTFFASRVLSQHSSYFGQIRGQSCFHLFVAEEYDVSVLEDTPVGTEVVDSLLATDRDVGMNARITYDITTNLVSVESHSVLSNMRIQYLHKM